MLQVPVLQQRGILVVVATGLDVYPGLAGETSSSVSDVPSRKFTSMEMHAAQQVMPCCCRTCWAP
ncbi:MAG: hypothetical protein ABI894_03630 [Ilumatobacteraceae bacterium]